MAQRWSDDEEAEGPAPARRRRFRRGVRRAADDAELTWDVDPALFVAPDLPSADVDLDDRSDIDEAIVAFEERYDAEELAAIEAGISASDYGDDEPVTGVSQWRRRSAIGAVLTGMALGLREVFDPEQERSIVIEVDDDGEPLDLPVDLFLDPDSPAGSLCIVHRDAGIRPPSV